MKKFVVLLIIAAAIGAGVYFYDPYLKPHSSPLLEGFTKQGPEPVPVPGDSQGEGAESADAMSAKTRAPGTGSDRKTTATAVPPKAVAPLSEIDQLLERKYPLPQVLPLMQIVDNWNHVPDNAFPTEVALVEKVSFTLNGPDGQPIGASVAVPGTLVQPARLDNPTLTIVSLANRAMRTQVDVDATDFKSRIQQRYDTFIGNATARVTTQRDKARKVLIARPEAVAAAASTSWDSADDPRFTPVKASLAANDLHSAKAEEATAFRWSGKQTISGDRHRGSYETAVVSFDVKTIFGVFPTEWMALIDAGKVVGWVDPITHESPAL
jgi:hypothetical protein